MGKYCYECSVALALAALILGARTAQAFEPDGTFNRCVSILTTAPQPSNIVKLLAKLQVMHLAKGEYETTAEYSARMAKLDLPHQITLTTPVLSREGQYDADAQRLSYSADDLKDAMQFSGEIDASRMKFIRAFDSYHSRDVGKYVGQNAFGARVRVTAATRSHHYVSAFDDNDIRDFGSISFDLQPTRAKALRPHLEWIAVGGIDPVSLRKEEHFYEATIDSPVQIAETDYLVTMKTECIGIRDARTHELLGSFQPISPLR